MRFSWVNLYFESENVKFLRWDVLEMLLFVHTVEFHKFFNEPCLVMIIEIILYVFIWVQKWSTCTLTFERVLREGKT